MEKGSFDLLSKRIPRDTRGSFTSMVVESVAALAMTIPWLNIELPKGETNINQSNVSNVVSIDVSTGGNTASPGETIVTGEESADVFIETTIHGTVVDRYEASSTGESVNNSVHIEEEGVIVDREVNISTSRATTTATPKTSRIRESSPKLEISTDAKASTTPIAIEWTKSTATTERTSYTVTMLMASTWHAVRGFLQKWFVWD